MNVITPPMAPTTIGTKLRSDLPLARGAASGPGLRPNDGEAFGSPCEEGIGGRADDEGLRVPRESYCGDSGSEEDWLALVGAMRGRDVNCTGPVWDTILGVIAWFETLNSDKMLGEDGAKLTAEDCVELPLKADWLLPDPDDPVGVIGICVSAMCELCESGGSELEAVSQG